METENENKLICPECTAIMDKKNKYGIKINKCINCGGIYLKNKQLKKLINKIIEEEDNFCEGFIIGSGLF